MERDEGVTRGGAEPGEEPGEPAQEPRVGEGADRVAALESKLAELSATLAGAREALDAAERRHAIDLELVRHEAVDLETARLMTEAAAANLAAKDAARAVAELKRRKPFLFRRSAAGVGMSPETPARANGHVGVLAEEAAGSGDRRALLRYLRAKRGG